LYLFLYETFNILVNARRSNAKEEEFALQQNKANSRYGGPPRRGKVLSSPGFAVTGNDHGDLKSVRLYDEPPHGVMLSKEKSRSSRDSALFFKGCRDDDLLLLSCRKLDLRGKDDIK